MHRMLGKGKKDATKLRTKAKKLRTKAPLGVHGVAHRLCITRLCITQCVCNAYKPGTRSVLGKDARN